LALIRNLQHAKEITAKTPGFWKKTQKVIESLAHGWWKVLKLNHWNLFCEIFKHKLHVIRRGCIKYSSSYCWV